MPDFGDPFAGNNLDRRLSEKETERCIRFAMSAEFEAVQIYEQIADATNDDRVRKVMLDIAKEERVHAGEFLALLKKVRPEESDELDEGEQEVEGILK